MAVKTSEIYSSLWASCDALRGGMDASQYKDYVLVLGGSFADMVALRGDKDIGEKIDVIISKLAEANDLRGAIDVATFNVQRRFGDRLQLAAGSGEPETPSFLAGWAASSVVGFELPGRDDCDPSIDFTAKYFSGERHRVNKDISVSALIESEQSPVTIDAIARCVILIVDECYNTGVCTRNDVPIQGSMAGMARREPLV